MVLRSANFPPQCGEFHDGGPVIVFAGRMRFRIQRSVGVERIGITAGSGVHRTRILAAGLAIALGGFALVGCTSDGTSNDSVQASSSDSSGSSDSSVSGVSGETSPAPQSTAHGPSDTTGAGGTSSDTSVDAAVGAGATRHVPKDFATVQAAVDGSSPGDLILIDPGIYNEAVVVRVNDITIRGMDRNTVIFDGGDEIENGITVAADGVAVENLTLRKYAFNGLLFTKAYDDDVDAKQHTVLKGYSTSYVTAHNNGAYGIYAFFAQGGRIDHTYTSGHPDSGIYVGQCKPCDAVVSDNVSELNAIGYSGTNASGNLFIINSVWRRNRIGMTPNSQDQERLAPQGDVVLAGNLVADNQDPGAPATPKGAAGFGIAVNGGERNQVVKNRVVGNSSAGIALTDFNTYKPAGNVITENVLEGNGTDLVFASTAGQASLDAAENCFAKNTFATSLPDAIETAFPCDQRATGSISTGVFQIPTPPPDVDYRSVPAPADQPNMPDAATALRTAVSRGVPAVDLSTITVPPAQ